MGEEPDLGIFQIQHDGPNGDRNHKEDREEEDIRGQRVRCPRAEDAAIEPEEQQEEEQPQQREIEPRESGHIRLLKDSSGPD